MDPSHGWILFVVPSMDLGEPRHQKRVYASGAQFWIPAPTIFQCSVTWVVGSWESLEVFSCEPLFTYLFHLTHLVKLCSPAIHLVQARFLGIMPHSLVYSPPNPHVVIPSLTIPTQLRKRLNSEHLFSLASLLMASCFHSHSFCIY